MATGIIIAKLGVGALALIVMIIGGVWLVAATDRGIILNQRVFKVTIRKPASTYKFKASTIAEIFLNTWSVTIKVPKDMRISPVFVCGIYEDLATHVGMHVNVNPVVADVAQDQD